MRCEDPARRQPSSLRSGSGPVATGRRSPASSGDGAAAASWDGEPAVAWWDGERVAAAWSGDAAASVDASSPAPVRRASLTPRTRTEQRTASEWPYRRFSLPSGNSPEHRGAPPSAASSALRVRRASLAVPGGAPWAGADAALALAVPHTRCALGVHPRPAAPADSPLAVTRLALPVHPTVRAVGFPHGEARSRQQHHQTSCQNQTTHHHSLLVALRLSCRHRWPANRAGEPGPPVACNSTEGRGASRPASQHRSLRSGTKCDFHGRTDRPRAS
jgi:hypothetical protein